MTVRHLLVVVSAVTVALGGVLYLGCEGEVNPQSQDSGPAPPCPEGTDADQDGYGTNCPAGADCDDTDATFHPGAA